MLRPTVEEYRELVEGRFRGVAGDFRPLPEIRRPLRRIGEQVLKRGSMAGDEVVRAILRLPQAPVWDKNFFTWIFLGETAAFLGPLAAPFFLRSASENEGVRKRLFLTLADFAEHGLPEDWGSLEGYLRSPWEAWRVEESERPAEAPTMLGQRLRQTWPQILRYSLAAVLTAGLWVGMASFWPTQGGFLLASGLSLLMVLVALYWEEAKMGLCLLLNWRKERSSHAARR